MKITESQLKTIIQKLIKEQESKYSFKYVDELLETNPILYDHLPDSEVLNSWAGGEFDPVRIVASNLSMGRVVDKETILQAANSLELDLKKIGDSTSEEDYINLVQAIEDLKILASIL